MSHSSAKIIRQQQQQQQQQSPPFECVMCVYRDGQQLVDTHTNNCLLFDLCRYYDVRQLNMASP